MFFLISCIFTIYGCLPYIITSLLHKEDPIFLRVSGTIPALSKTIILIRRKSYKVLTKSYGIQNRKSNETEGHCSHSVTEPSNYGNNFTSCSHEVLQRLAGSALSCSHKFLQTHATCHQSVNAEWWRPMCRRLLFAVLKKSGMGPSCGCAPHAAAETMTICQPASISTREIHLKHLRNNKIVCVL